MTVVARRIASIPRRTSVDTWVRLLELVSSPGSAARGELESILSIASMLIAEEYTRLAPVTISGGGPLVRIYTVHGEDAVEYDLDEETPLAFQPTAGTSWRLSLHALGADVEVARAAITHTSHIAIRDAADIEESSAKSSLRPTSMLVLDAEELERP